jgi:hypothetical protein
MWLIPSVLPNDRPRSFATLQLCGAHFRSHPICGHQKAWRNVPILTPGNQLTIGGIAIQNFGPLIRARGPSLSHMSHSVSSHMTRQGNDCGNNSLLPRIQVPPLTRIRSSFLGAVAIGCQALFILLTCSAIQAARDMNLSPAFCQRLSVSDRPSRLRLYHAQMTLQLPRFLARLNLRA